MNRSFCEHKNDNRSIRSKNYASTETSHWSRWGSSKQGKKVLGVLRWMNRVSACDCLEKSERTLIIGVAISCVLVIIAVLGIFYVLRRQCVDRHEKNDPAQEQDRAVDSLASHMSDKTELSEKTSNTGSSFVPWVAGRLNWISEANTLSATSDISRRMREKISMVLFGTQLYASDVWDRLVGRSFIRSLCRSIRLVYKRWNELHALKSRGDLNG